MPGFSTSLANALIDFTLRGQPAPTIRTTYYALFTADPTDDFKSDTEVSASWYARQPTGVFKAPVNGASYNAVNAEFPRVDAGTVTVTHIGIVEGASPTDATSTLLYSSELTDSITKLPKPITLAVGDIYAIRFDATSGDFAIELL